MSPKFSGEVKRLGSEMGGKMVERKKSLGIKPDRSAHIEARKKMIERRANKPLIAKTLANKLRAAQQSKNSPHYVEGGMDKPKPRQGGSSGKRNKEQTY